MQKPGFAASILAGITAGILVMLLLLPLTRPTLQAHLTMPLTSSGHPPWVASSIGVDSLDRREMAARDRQLARVAKTRPGNVDIQIAWALRSPEHAETPQKSALLTVEKLLDVCDAFPESAAVRAVTLRHMSRSGGLTLMWRPEISLLLQEKRLQTKPQPVPPKLLERVEQAALEGELLEPNNAYFPAVLAVLHYSSREDARATQAIQRAARCSRWNQHIQSETRGKILMSRRAFGRQSPVGEFAVYASTLYPDFAGIRNAARIATYQAMKLEEAGDLESGVRLRLQVWRLGSLMRGSADSLMGNLTGVSVVTNGCLRPGGSAASAGKKSSEPDEQLLGVHKDMLSFLTANGFEDAAAWLRAELDAGRGMRDIIGKDYLIAPLRSSIVRQLAVFLTLSNLVLLAMIGLLATLATGVARASDDHPLEPRARLWGAGLLILAALLFFTAYQFQASFVAVISGLVLMIAAVVMYMISRTTPGGARGWRIASLLAAGAGICAAAAGWLAQYFRAGLLLSLGLSSMAHWETPGPVIVALFLLAAAVAPLLLVLISLLFSIRRACPAFSGMILSTRRWALPLITVLAVLYAGLVIHSVRQDAAFSKMMMESVANEGLYQAQRQGVAWPPPIPLPTDRL